MGTWGFAFPNTSCLIERLKISFYMYSKLAWEICIPFIWVQFCQQTSHSHPLLYVSLLFCKTYRLNEGLWLYTFTWIIIRLVKCYFVLKIEKGSNAVSSTRIVLWKEKCCSSPTATHSSLWNVFESIMHYLSQLMLNIRILIILHKPNYDFKHACFVFVILMKSVYVCNRAQFVRPGDMDRIQIIIGEGKGCFWLWGWGRRHLVCRNLGGGRSGQGTFRNSEFWEQLLWGGTVNSFTQENPQSRNTVANEKDASPQNHGADHLLTMVFKCVFRKKSGKWKGRLELIL